MDKKTATLLLILLVSLFIGFGDRVLPKPLSTASLNSRTAVNNFLTGLFPDRKPRNRAKEREDKIERQVNPDGTQ